MTDAKKAQTTEEAIAAGKAPPPSMEDVSKELEGSTVHTYPDGTQVVGRPPFDPMSPRERQAAMARGEGDPVNKPGMSIPPGRPTSGEAPKAPAGGVTEDELAAKAAAQLSADVLSGKSPDTPNPTTSSDKPELAGTGGTAAEVGKDLTPEEIEAIAKNIQPEGNIEATDEQRQAAATQVAREVKGPIVEGDKPTPAKKK